MFEKILIANRGEIAVRLIRACRAMNIKTVAIHSTADRHALHVYLADESICVGPADVADSYMNATSIIAAAKGCGASAIAPGYGFLSTNPTFAKLCEQNDIVFIGCSPSALKMFSSRECLAQLVSEVKKNQGIDIQLAPEDLIANSPAGIRQISVQVIADGFGNIVTLGCCDCSVQYEQRKLIVESPVHFSEDESLELQNVARALVGEAKATGVVSVNFVIDDGQRVFLKEIDGRMTVEHPVIEMITGTDLAEEAIHIAAGEPLSLTQDAVTHAGHSLMCRVNAEIPAEDFKQFSGTISQTHLPGGNGVRVDTASFDGSEVSPYYGSLIAKIIVQGANREQAIAKMRTALDEMVIVGVQTNLDFLFTIMNNRAYREGNIDTRFVEKFMNGEL